MRHRSFFAHNILKVNMDSLKGLKGHAVAVLDTQVKSSFKKVLNGIFP